jgi:hypothetical protein
MKNEDKIVELLSELLIRQDRTESILNKMGTILEKLADSQVGLTESQKSLGDSQERVVDSQEKLIRIQERQEKVLIQILEVLEDDVPKFDELLEMEQFEGGKKIVLRKTRK